MNKNISVIAIKLFGVYLGVSFLRSLPAAFVVLFLEKVGFMANKLPYFIINIVHLLIQLSLALLFIFRTQMIVKFLRFPVDNREDMHKESESTLLSLGLILIGVYFLLSSLPFLISCLVALIPGTDFNTIFSGSHWWAKCGEKIISALFAIILILSSKVIATCITEAFDQETLQQNCQN